MVVDEAAFCKETDITAAIGHCQPKHLALFGDPMQLEPVCNSKEARDGGLDISLFQRLQTTTSGQQCCIFLKDQHRTDPELFQVVSELFYESRISTVNKPGARAIMAPLTVWNDVAKDSIESKCKTSYVNLREPPHVVDLLSQLKINSS